MRKKRSRISIRPAPFLWLFLCVNIVAGLFFSRITSVVHVRTDGVRAFDRERIEGILTKLQDIPCSKIDARDIESQVLKLPEVDRAELTRNPFGNALLTVQYRTPVARLDGTDGVVLSNDGVLYEGKDFPEDIPALELAKAGPPAFLTLAGTWEPERLAELAVYAHGHYPQSELKIVVDDRGSVCLNIGAGRVRLGSCDDLQLKLKTFEKWFQGHPKELDQVQEVNLTTPSAIAFKAKRVGKQ